MTDKTDVAIRDKKGRFVAGHGSISPGRPTRARETRYLQALTDTVTMDDWILIVRRAIEDAQNGSHPARRWVADYLVGPPIKQSELTVSGDVSLTGPSLDRRMRLIMATLVAAMVNSEDEQLSALVASLDTSNVIDGEIVGQNEETEESE